MRFVKPCDSSRLILRLRPSLAVRLLLPRVCSIVTDCRELQATWQYSAGEISIPQCSQSFNHESEMSSVNCPVHVCRIRCRTRPPCACGESLSLSRSQFCEAG